MSESSPLSRRERERDLRRREMLEAAKAVFAEKSFAEATVDEIAEQAQFGKGTLYLYFKAENRNSWRRFWTSYSR